MLNLFKLDDLCNKGNLKSMNTNRVIAQKIFLWKKS